MPIQLQEPASLLSTIVALCFSFCVPVIALWFRKAESLPKLLGFSFIPVFLLVLLSLLVSDYALSAALWQMAEPMLLLLFILVLATVKEKGNNLPAKSGLLLIPAVLLLLPVLWPASRTLLSLALTASAITVAGSVAVLYLLKDKKGDLNLLFWAMLPFLASGIAQYYLTTGILAFSVPLLKSGTYIVLLVYFYRAFLVSQIVKIGEAEKKLAAINRSIEYEVKKRMLEIERVNQNLVNIAKTDSMSKVLNKVALLDSIEKLILSKPGSEFSIVMFDIDNFKSINDTLGHLTGDKCIKLLAASARNNIRDIDLVGRYGGDEFVIILPGTAANQAVMVAERFRKRVGATDSPHFTISIGIATYPSDGTDVKSLIEAADEGLYRSKRKGRNAVSHRNFY